MDETEEIKITALEAVEGGEGEDAMLGDPLTVHIQFVPSSPLENVVWTMSYEIDHVGKHGSVVLAETEGASYAGGEEASVSLSTAGMDLSPHKRAHLLNTGLLKLVLANDASDTLVQISMVVMVSKGPQKTLLRRILNPLS